MIQPYIYLYILFHILFHYGLLQNIEYSSLCYAIGCYCSSMPYILYPNTTKLFIVFSTHQHHQIVYSFLHTPLHWILLLCLYFICSLKWSLLSLFCLLMLDDLLENFPNNLFLQLALGSALASCCFLNLTSIINLLPVTAPMVSCL